MRIIVSITLSFWICLLSAQQITPGIFASAGEVYDNGNNSIQWTLGELLVNQKSTSSISMSEGFHQLFMEDMSTAIASVNIDASVLFFPNPVQHKLHIIIGNEKNYEYSIIATNGKVLNYGAFSQRILIDVSSLESGGYFIDIRKGNSERGVYFFVKI